MNGRSGLEVASIRGFDVRLDPSWLVLFFLVLWSLSAGTFPALAPELDGRVHVLMGVVGTLLFCTSILVHELAHSLVARSRGIEIDGITLFVFGGMAHTRREPQDPDDELVIAGIGPVVSFILGGLFLLIAALGRGMGWSPAVHEVAQYLGSINLMLAVFNFLPGYPLDGGRVLRALVWKRTGDLARATRWAATAGRWLGLALIVFGAAQTLLGSLVGGLWLVLIGTFLRGAAGMAATQQALDQALRGVRAADVMSRDMLVIDAHMTLRDIAYGAALRSPRAAFPVRENGRIVGTLPVSRLTSTPREAWSATSVGKVMSALDEDVVVAPETEMSEVLDKMRSAEDGEVLVMEDDAVVGSISRADVAQLASRARAVAGA